MPVYYVKGLRYEIPEEKVRDFITSFPDAQPTVVFSSDHNDYNIPLDKVDQFKKEFPTALQWNNVRGGEQPISEEEEFQAFYSEVSKTKGLSPDPDDKLQQYDYRGYYNKNKFNDQELERIKQPEEHFPSEFKDDYHPNRMVKEGEVWLDTKYGKTATEEQYKRWDNARRLKEDDIYKAFQPEEAKKESTSVSLRNPNILTKSQIQLNILENQNAELSVGNFFKEVFPRLESGGYQLGSLMSMVPAGVTELVYLPQNLLSIVPKYADELAAMSRLPGYGWLNSLAKVGKKYPKAFEGMERHAPKILTTDNPVYKMYQQLLEDNRATYMKFDNDIGGYFKDGNIGAGLALLGLEVAENLPMQFAILAATFSGVGLPVVMGIVGAGSAGEKFTQLISEDRQQELKGRQEESIRQLNPEDRNRLFTEGINKALISSGLGIEDFKQLNPEDKEQRLVEGLNQALEEAGMGLDDVSMVTKQINALFHGGMEALWEGLGTGRLGKTYGQYVRRFGAEAGDKLFSMSVVKSIITGVRNKGAILTDRIIEGIEELGTQLTQNLNDIFTGVNPNLNAWTGTFDAFAVGIGSAVATTMPLDFYTRSVQKKIEGRIDTKMDKGIKDIRAAEEKDLANLNKMMADGKLELNEQEQADLKAKLREEAEKQIAGLETLRTTLKEKSEEVGVAGTKIFSESELIPENPTVEDIDQIINNVTSDEVKQGLERTKQIDDPDLRRSSVERLYLIEKRNTYEFGTPEWVAVNQDLVGVMEKVADRRKVVQKDIKDAIQAVKKHFVGIDNANQQIWELSVLARTVQHDIDEGLITKEDAIKRIEEHGYSMTDLKPEDMLVLGSTQEVIINEATKDLIRIYGGANPATLIEERSHAFYNNEVRHDAKFDDKVTQWKAEYEKNIGEVINKSNIEWFGTLSRRYAMGIEPKGKIHAELRKILEKIKAYYNSWFNQGTAFANLVKAGKINPELVDYLDRSINEPTADRVSTVMDMITTKPAKVKPQKKVEVAPTTKPKVSVEKVEPTTELPPKKAKPKGKTKYKKQPKEKTKFVKPKEKTAPKVVAPVTKKKAVPVKETAVEVQPESKKLTLRAVQTATLGQEVFIKGSQSGKFLRATITELNTDKSGKINSAIVENKDAKIEAKVDIDKIYEKVEAPTTTATPTKVEVPTALQTAAQRNAAKRAQLEVLKEQLRKGMPVKVQSKKKGQKPSKIISKQAPIPKTEKQLSAQQQALVDHYREIHPEGMPLTEQEALELAQDALTEQNGLYMDDQLIDDIIDRQESDEVLRDDKGKRVKKHYDLQSIREGWLEIPAFKEWHKGVKTLDDDGVSPLLGYHGTNVERLIGGRFGLTPNFAGWFAVNPEYASYYNGTIPELLSKAHEDPKFREELFTKEIYANIIPVIIGLRSPYIFSHPADFDVKDFDDLIKILKYEDVNPNAIKEIEEGLKKQYELWVADQEYKGISKYELSGWETSGAADLFLQTLKGNSSPLYAYLDSDAFGKIMLKYGIDGIMANEVGEDTYAVYNKTRIKSLYNIGTYSQKSPKINYDLMPVDKAIDMLDEELSKTEIMRELMGSIDSSTEFKKQQKYNIREFIMYRRAFISSKMLDLKKIIRTIDELTTHNERQIIPFMIEDTGIPKALNRPDLEKLYKELENDKEFRKIVAMAQEHYDAIWKEMVAFYPDMTYEQKMNYVTHIWDVGLFKGKKHIDISNWFMTKNPFLKKRRLESLAEGIKEGYVPNELDISQLILIHGKATYRAMANAKFIEDIKLLNVDGIPLVVKANEAPDHWRTMNHPALRRLTFSSAGKTEERTLKDGTVKPSKSKGTLISFVPVKVHPDIEDALNVIFQEVSNDKFDNAYDMVGGFLKKTKLSLSFFHHLALSETGVATIGWWKTLMIVNPFTVIYKGFINGDSLAFTKHEIAHEAVLHNLQLGASGDIPISRIAAQLRKLEERYSGTSIGRVLTSTLRSANDRWDHALWDWLHDGLKLVAYETLTSKIPVKVMGADRTRVKREIAQFVNDTFGGQNFDVLMIQPKTVKRMQRSLLSFDWQVSTLRQAVAPFGVGALYKDGISKKTRMKLGGMFWLNAFFKIGVLMNLLNAVFRYWDKEKYPEDYSGREFSWFDYTIFRNVVGHKTHLFVGRYKDGTERYVRWGKQFRELPELFYDDFGGIVIGKPAVKKIVSKVHPIPQMLVELSAGTTLSGYDNWKLREARGWRWTWVAAAEIAKSPLPFSMRNLVYPYKEQKLTDLFVPSSKGANRRGLIEYYKFAIKSYNLGTPVEDIEDEIQSINYAAIQNRIDPAPLFNAALAQLEGELATELLDGARLLEDLETELENTDPAKTPTKYMALISKTQAMRKELMLYQYGHYKIAKEVMDAQRYIEKKEELKY